MSELHAFFANIWVDAFWRLLVVLGLLTLHPAYYLVRSGIITPKVFSSPMILRTITFPISCSKAAARMSSTLCSSNPMRTAIADGTLHLSAPETDALAVPLGRRIARGLYADGIWADLVFVPYDRIDGISWREAGDHGSLVE